MADLKSSKSKRGGARKGAGKPKGTLWPSTIAKEQAREVARQMITRELEPLIRTHIANAQGTKYLVVRNVKTGKFERLNEERMKLLLESGDEQLEAVEVYDKDPSVEAFKTLMDRALDQPAKPVEQVNATGTITLKWQD